MFQPNGLQQIFNVDFSHVLACRVWKWWKWYGLDRRRADGVFIVAFLPVVCKGPGAGQAGHP